MGLHFGELYRGMRGIITYRLSPFEMKAFGGLLSKGLPNVVRRIRESFFTVAPPFIGGYLVFDYVEKKHKRLMKKNPDDYKDDK